MSLWLWLFADCLLTPPRITVTFSISDLQNYEPDFSPEEDGAFGDELDEYQGSSQQQQSLQQQKRGNAELESEAEEFELDEDEPSGTVPVRLNIVIEKPNKGALNVEAVAQDGTVVVENVFYYNDPKIALNADPEAVHKGVNAYSGPMFGSLDEDLQILLERYLEERGINSALAVFVTDFIDYKEQKEYLNWLKNVKAFVDA